MASLISSRVGLALAHLAPGVTLDRANQDLAAVSPQLAAEYPLNDAGWSARAYASLQAVMGPNDPTLHSNRGKMAKNVYQRPPTEVVKSFKRK